MSTTSARLDDVEKLANLVQSLPRELFDIVYDMIFTPEPDPVEMSRAWKPPRRPCWIAPRAASSPAATSAPTQGSISPSAVKSPCVVG